MSGLITFFLEQWLFSVVVAAGVVVWLLRWVLLPRWLRRQAVRGGRWEVAAPGEEVLTHLTDIPIEALVESTEQDERATALIGSYRAAIWMEFERRSLSWEEVRSRCEALVREIAAVYYPTDEFASPFQELRPVDVVLLVNRVSDRLYRLMEAEPLRQLARQKFRTYWRLHEATSPYYQLYKRYEPYLRWGNRAFTASMWVANPLGAVISSIGKFAGREVVVRYLTTTLVVMVGEEARRLFRNRYLEDGELLFGEVVFAAMLNLALADGKLSVGEYEHLVRFLDSPRVTEANRARMVRMLAQRREVALDWESLRGASEGLRREVMRMAEQVAASDAHGSEARRQVLTEYEQRLGVPSRLLREMLDTAQWGKARQVFRGGPAEQDDAALRLAVAVAAWAGKQRSPAFREFLGQEAARLAVKLTREELEQMIDLPPDLDEWLELARTWPERSLRERAGRLSVGGLLTTLPLTAREADQVVHAIAPALRLGPTGERFLQQCLWEYCAARCEPFVKPPREVLFELFGKLQPGEELLAWVPTATSVVLGAEPQPVQAVWWLALSSERLLAVAAAMDGQRVVSRLQQFDWWTEVHSRQGRVFDEYQMVTRELESFSFGNAAGQRDVLRGLMQRYQERSQAHQARASLPERAGPASS